MFRSALAVFTAVFVTIMPASLAFAQDSMGQSGSEDKPLLIIRFNQARVPFDNALSKAIGAAERAKPDMQYEVISYIPELGNPVTSRANLQAVVGGMQMHGADISRITWRSELASGNTQEVHVYVR